MATTPSKNIPLQCRIRKVMSSLPEIEDSVARSLAALSNYAHDGDHPKIKKEVKYVNDLLAKELKRVRTDLETVIAEHNRTIRDLKENFKASEKAFCATEKALQARVSFLQEEMSLEMSFNDIMDTLEKKTEEVPSAKTEEVHVPPAETEDVPPAEKKTMKQRALCK